MKMMQGGALLGLAEEIAHARRPEAHEELDELGAADRDEGHARLSRDAKGRWHVNNNKSVNGVWLRIEQMELTGSCQFQIGEQRFSFKVP